MRRNRIVRALALALACLGAVGTPRLRPGSLPAAAEDHRRYPRCQAAADRCRQPVAPGDRPARTQQHADDCRAVAADAEAGRRAHQPEDQRPAADDAAHRHHHPTAVRQPEDQGGGAPRGETRLARLLGGRRPHRLHRDQGGRNRAVGGGREDGRREGHHDAEPQRDDGHALRVGQRRHAALPVRPGHARAGTQGAARYPTARTSRRTSASRRRSAPTRTC